MAIDTNSIGSERTITSNERNPGCYTLTPGTTLGQYRIIRPLGRGGMGEVYEVEHTTLARCYALKLLPADFATQQGALDRFRREAKVMANLDHPNILKVDDFGEAEGRYWLRMELASGAGPKSKGDGQLVSLQELADDHGGKIKQEILVGILEHILEGLKFAHDHSVVHRDMKPSNVLLFGDGEGCTFKIADFGLVRLVGEDWVRSQAQNSVQRSMSMGDMRTMGAANGMAQGSSTRSMLGTFEYMSPEQKRGEDADARSDLYAVGLMAYRLLTGRSNVLKLPSRVDDSLVSGWDDFVEQTLEEEPSDRLTDAAAGLVLLGAISNQLAVVDEAPAEHEKRAAEERERAGEARKVQEEEVRFKKVAEDSAMHECEQEQRQAVEAAKAPEPVQTKWRGPVEGQSWASPATGMEFVWIDALQIWVGKYEVTNGEYRIKESEHDSGDFQGHSLDDDQQPVVYVNFEDAKDYAEWLTEYDHSILGSLCYRLPSEEEWQSYCQCGDDRLYPWGNEWPPRSGHAGNYHGEEGAAGWNKIYEYNDGFPVTATVHKLWRNPWGLYGVGGNVWEACARNSSGLVFGAWRGASWNVSCEENLRCAYRVCNRSASRYYSTGFRLVLSQG